MEKEFWEEGGGSGWEHQGGRERGCRGVAGKGGVRVFVWGDGRVWGGVVFLGGGGGSGWEQQVCGCVLTHSGTWTATLLSLGTLTVR